MIPLCLILFCLPTADSSSRAAPLDAKISTVEGATLDVQITSIQSDVLYYRSSNRDDRIPIGDVERIVPSAPPASLRISTDKSVCTFLFADGGWLEGRLLPPLDPADKLIHVDVGWARPLSFRLDALSAVQFGGDEHAAAEAEFQSRLAHRDAGRDFLIVPRAAKAVVLSGALEGLQPDQWTFRIGDKMQTASLDKAYAVVLGGDRSPQPEGYAMIELAGRRRIAARLISADSVALRVDSSAFGPLDLPWNDVASISLRSGRVVYLSDLETAETVQHSLFDVSWPPRRDTNVTGGPLVIDQRRYSKGLGVHAYTALTYNIDGKFERLVATIGVDDSAADGASAVFRVRGDDKTLLESKPMTPRRSAAVNVDLRGIRRLTLECDGGADLDLADHGDWAEARLIRASPNRTH